MNDYEPKRESTFITYLDMNNLYRWTMSEYLPYGGFKWLANIDNCDIISISDKSPIGYILEADLEYSDELHELHNDFPLVPKKFAVFNDMLSNYCKITVDQYDLKASDVKK